MNPAPPVGAIHCSTVQQRTDFGTTEHTEHTELRAQDIKDSFPCVPCGLWLAKMNLAPPVGAIHCSTIQQRTEFGTTEHTEHTEVRAQDIKDSFPCVPCILW